MQATNFSVLPTLIWWQWSASNGRPVAQGHLLTHQVVLAQGVELW